MNDNLISPLGFNYAYDTPSDPEYPLLNSISNDPKLCGGWSSVRYCSFPQVLIIKFFEVVSLRQIKILFHQYKIPKQVDVFFYIPSSFQEYYLDPLLIPFERLGYVIPQSNEASHFKLRELKSTMTNISCLYLKLQLHQCYENEYNTFNQVGLIRLECLGRGIGKQMVNRLYLNENDNDRVRPSCVIDLLIKDDDYDEMSRKKIKALKDRLHVEPNKDLQSKMDDTLEELRGYAKKILKLTQLSKNYNYLNDKVKESQTQKEINILNKLVDNILLPEGSFLYELEIPINQMGQQFRDTMTENSNDVYLQNMPNLDNMISNINSNDLSLASQEQGPDNESNYNHNQTKISSPRKQNQNSHSKDILNKFLLKKQLIHESHYNARENITRENILYKPNMNL